MKFAIEFMALCTHRPISESIDAFGVVIGHVFHRKSHVNHSLCAYNQGMTEQQPYTVLAQKGEIEIRHYPDYVLAQYEVTGDFMSAGNRAFGPLVSYISGENAGRNSIAMTAPVLQETTAQNTHVISFVMPSSMSRESLPAPIRSGVTMKQVSGHDVAAMTFGGGWNAERFAQKAKELTSAVHSMGLEPQGSVYFARYDPPWKPWFLKRNEVLIALAQPFEACNS